MPFLSISVHGSEWCVWGGGGGVRQNCRLHIPNLGKERPMALQTRRHIYCYRPSSAFSFNLWPVRIINHAWTMALNLYIETIEWIL